MPMIACLVVCSSGMMWCFSKSREAGSFQVSVAMSHFSRRFFRACWSRPDWALMMSSPRRRPRRPATGAGSVAVAALLPRVMPPGRRPVRPHRPPRRSADAVRGRGGRAEPAVVVAAPRGGGGRVEPRRRRGRGGDVRLQGEDHPLQGEHRAFEAAGEVVAQRLRVRVVLGDGVVELRDQPLDQRHLLLGDPQPPHRLAQRLLLLGVGDGVAPLLADLAAVQVGPRLHALPRSAA